MFGGETLVREFTKTDVSLLAFQDEVVKLKQQAQTNAIFSLFVADLRYAIPVSELHRLSE